MAEPISHRGRSIFTTQTVSYVVIILMTTLTFSVLFFSTAKSQLEQEVGRKLQDIASIAAKNAPVERLELIKVGDEQTRMVLRLKEKLGEIRAATGVSDILIFREDQSSLLDLRPDHAIGKAYDLPQFRPKFLERLRKGQPVSTGAYRVPGDGLFLSAYAPVTTKEGQLFAIVGVNAGAREMEVFDRLQSRLYLIGVVGLVIALGLALLLARRLSRPISGMARTAQRLGQGEYAARVPIPSTRELAVLAEAINEMADQVQTRDAQLKEISASVAHEIRNPLNSMRLLVTLLGEEVAEAGGDISARVTTLNREITKLDRFLTEFLTYSRPISLAHDRISPADLAQSAAAMAASEIDGEHIRLKVKLTDGLPKLTVDRDRLEQSLLNILLNAAQACDREGDVTLNVGMSDDGKSVEFVVTDTGPGIPEDMIGRLFRPFVTSKASGTGLGLSNASKIVMSHGGSITAENVPEGGARFVVRLPAPRGEGA